MYANGFYTRGTTGGGQMAAPTYQICADQAQILLRIPCTEHYRGTVTTIGTGSECCCRPSGDGVLWPVSTPENPPLLTKARGTSLTVLICDNYQGRLTSQALPTPLFHSGLQETPCLG